MAFFSTTFVFLEHRYGLAGVEAVLEQVRMRGFPDSFLAVTGLTIQAFESEWVQFLWDHYGEFDTDKTCSETRQ